MVFSQCYWINKLLQPGICQRCFVCLVIGAVKRQFLETHQIPVDTNRSCMFLHCKTSFYEGIKKSGSCFFTETQLQNMRLLSLSCPNNTDKYLVSEKAWLTAILAEENAIRKGGVYRLLPPRRSLLPKKSSTFRLLSLVLKGT